MQSQIYFLSQELTLLIILLVSILFAGIGIIYSKQHQGLENYLTANRSVGTTSLTTSLVASALGAWILFGPASAATAAMATRSVREHLSPRSPGGSPSGWAHHPATAVTRASVPPSVPSRSTAVRDRHVRCGVRVLRS